MPDGSKYGYLKFLEDLLKALLKSRLKISPKKCPSFRSELQYMVYIIFIKEKRICIKSSNTRLEAIQKLKQPKTAKDCKSFAKVINY